MDKEKSEKWCPTEFFVQPTYFFVVQAPDRRSDCSTIRGFGPMTCARRATAHAARLAMAAACRPTAIDSMTTRRVSDLAAATIPRFARGGVASSSRSPAVPSPGASVGSTRTFAARGLAAPSPVTAHGGGKDDPHAEKITVTFIEKDGTETVVAAPVGQSMLEVAHKNDIELEGACEGSLACSTCHVIINDQAVYDALPEPDDDENDMLDLAFGLTETSRLGCQVIAAKELDGMTLSLPKATRNFAVDGFVPKPH